MFQASFYHTLPGTLPKTSDDFFPTLDFVGFDPFFYSRVLNETKFLFITLGL